MGKLPIPSQFKVSAPSVAVSRWAAARPIWKRARREISPQVAGVLAAGCTRWPQAHRCQPVLACSEYKSEAGGTELRMRGRRARATAAPPSSVMSQVGRYRPSGRSDHRKIVPARGGALEPRLAVSRALS